MRYRERPPRLHVEPTLEPPGEFEVQVFIGGEELTSQGAGLGMDPLEILVPVNQFVAGDEPHTMPFARCSCGVYGCGETDVTIARDGDTVTWTFTKELPGRERVVFDAAQYDDAVAALDWGWESPEYTAGRLLRERFAETQLTSRFGLRLDFTNNDYRDPTRFQVCLRDDAAQQQIFVHVPWQGQSAEALVDEVVRTLCLEPSQWDDTEWLNNSSRSSGPPHYAGENWITHRLD